MQNNIYFIVNKCIYIIAVPDTRYYYTESVFKNVWDIVLF